MTKRLLAGLAVLTLGTGSALAQEKESGPDMRGLTVMVGGGVEGYTNALASPIDVGPTVGVTVALKPSKVLGLELGYTGAVHEFDDGVATSERSGPDLVRNGGQAVATIGLTSAGVQPYVLGGVGVSRYNIRADAPGYSSDTVGNVPVGAGLRMHFGSFTADARVNYNFLFNQQFAEALPTADVEIPGDQTFSDGGRYTGTINLGTTW